MSGNDEDESKGFRPGVHVERPSRQRPIKLVNLETGEVTGLTKPSEIVQSLLEQHGIATSLTPAQQVEEDLKTITVCEECQSAKLSMQPWSITRRRHTERPWRCRGCVVRERARLTTPEMKAAQVAKSLVTFPPERRRQCAAVMLEKRDTAKLSQSAKRRWAEMPEQKRLEIREKMSKSRTKEERSEARRQAWATRRAKKEQAA